MHTRNRVSPLLLVIALAAGGCAQLIGLEEPDDDKSEGDAGVPDGAAADASDPSDPDAGDALPPDAERRVFVTSGFYTGAFGGLAGADLRCQTEAQSADLGGHWVAWLADDTGSPSTRFVQGEASYRLLDGTVIATDWDDLVDGTLAAPINRTPSGVLPADLRPTWTNVTPTGEVRDTSPNAHCDNWIDQNNTTTGLFGENNQSGAEWTVFPGFTYFCFSTLKLYCFEK